MRFLYIIVAFIATLAGTLTGLGGGVIIKPVMDMISNYPVDTIGVISSITVFSMSLVSVTKHLRKGTRMPLLIVIPIALGSAVGGILGQIVLDELSLYLPMDQVKLIQNSVMLVLLVGVFLYMHYKPTLGYKPKKIVFLSLLVGISLGVLSSLLGIGGGPFNIVAFLFIFTFDIKMASIASLVSILFSQFAKLITITLSTGFAGYNLEIVPYMVFAAIFGAQVAGQLNKHMTAQRVEVLFMVMLWLITGISIYNIVVGVI